MDEKSLITKQRLLTAKIMIVDDEPANVKLLLKIFKQHRYTNVISTTDPNQAIDLFFQERPDILLLDLNMPLKSGFEILQDLTKAYSDYLPVLVLTAYSDKDIRILALRSGAKDYLVKPIDGLEVITRVNNILEVKLLIDIIRDQNETLEEKIHERTQKLQHEMLERQRAEEASLFAATHDHLTSLPNYITLYDEIEQNLGAEPGQSIMALLVLSLNRFNEINKTLGHQNGDRILQTIARRISQSLRGFVDAAELQKLRRGDTITRYAGGKFAIILRFLKGPRNISRIADRVISEVRKPVEIEGLLLETDASIGAALFTDTNETSNAVIRKAEIALQWARDTHKEFAIYSDEIDTYSPKRLALMAELRQTIDSNGLLLHYQPIVDINSMQIKAIEALSRWQHRQDGHVPPEDFVASAEQSGLIKPLTRWVLRTAIQEVSQLWKLNPDLSLSVNMSAYCLQDDEFVRYIKSLIKSNPFPVNRLTLEITESAMMVDPAKALAVLNQLNDLGVSLSIDDFGTGYSSLVYLKRLPVNQVKIDRSFIKDLLSDENDRLIVRATVEMGHNFNLSVVAEGAEDQETVDALREYGTDYIQGNYFARPMPIQEVSAWIEDRKTTH